MPRPREGGALVETGVYARVRHPIYGGLVLAAFGWGLIGASPVGLLLSAALLGFFTLKSTREEAWLVERFPGYPAYRRRTKRFIPFVV
jgi:protein-S-isoprenylcysteine O-methyltransferase Ste14